MVYMVYEDPAAMSHIEMLKNKTPLKKYLT